VVTNREGWRAATPGLSLAARGLLMELSLAVDDDTAELADASERSLVRIVRAARGTVRRCLRELEDAGLVEIEDGVNQFRDTVIRLPRFDEVRGVDEAKSMTAEVNAFAQYMKIGLEQQILSSEEVDLLVNLRSERARQP
jgi:hypothetical protein